MWGRGRRAAALDSCPPFSSNKDTAREFAETVQLGTLHGVAKGVRLFVSGHTEDSSDDFSSALGVSWLPEDDGGRGEDGAEFARGKGFQRTQAAFEVR